MSDLHTYIVKGNCVHFLLFKDYLHYVKFTLGVLTSLQCIPFLIKIFFDLKYLIIEQTMIRFIIIIAHRLYYITVFNRVISFYVVHYHYVFLNEILAEQTL